MRAFLGSREKLLDAIPCRFASADFTDDRPLAGEFLLGYHCQRAAFFSSVTEKIAEEPTAEETTA